MVKKMIINIKFTKNKQSGFLAGYVTKQNGSWKGCRADDPRNKKIVLPGQEVKSGLMENVLYRTKVIPMKEKDGFVAIKVEPVQFDARIETVFIGKKYRIEVRFGNKTLVYDPFCKKNQQRSDMAKFRKTLESRPDIKDLQQVVDDFLDMANIQAACAKD